MPSTIQNSLYLQIKSKTRLNAYIFGLDFVRDSAKGEGGMKLQIVYETTIHLSMETRKKPNQE